MAIVSAFLPWVNAGIDSSSGINNGATDGWFVIAVSSIIAVWEVRNLSNHRSASRVTAVIQGLMAGVIGLLGITDIRNMISQADINTIGTGLYLLLLAVALLVAGAVWRLVTV